MMEVRLEKREMANATPFIEVRVIVVTDEGNEGVHSTQQLVAEHDFKSHWDQIWDTCKFLLDEELANAK